jgi:hypothetical protein
MRRPYFDTEIQDLYREIGLTFESIEMSEIFSPEVEACREEVGEWKLSSTPS